MVVSRVSPSSSVAVAGEAESSLNRRRFTADDEFGFSELLPPVSRTDFVT